MVDLYIACCTEDGGVAHVVLGDDGRLQRQRMWTVPATMYLTLESGRLYALFLDPLKTGESAVAAFELDERYEAGFTSAVPTGGMEACHLSVVGENVYVANYQTGSVAKITPDGRFVRRHESGALASHPHFIAPSPDGKYLLCADLGLDTIFTYDRDLAPRFTAKTPAGSGPRHLAFSPDGKTVYCVNEIGNTVTVFSYENGRLTPLETVDVLPGYDGESYAAALRLYDGKLYVSHRGADCITVYRTDKTRLLYEETIACGGKWPRDFDKFGEFLVCTNEKSDSVTVLRQTDGKWAVCSSLSLPRPLCVVGKERSDDV